MVHTVQDLERVKNLIIFVVQSNPYHTHALPSRNQGRNPECETNRREQSPCTSSAAQCDENSCNEAHNDPENTKSTSEYHTRPITIAYTPANEVWMSLVTERPFDSMSDVPTRRWVCSVRQSMKKCSTLPR